jgi:hypothetical protein
MTAVNDRLAALERLLGSDHGRQRRIEEAVAEAARKVINAVNHLAAGHAPTCPVEHALVDNDLDILAAIEQVLEARRRPER